MSLVLLAITALAYLLSLAASRRRTLAALRLGWRSLLGIAPGLLGMVGAVGLALALLPPDTLAALFRRSGVAGFVLVALTGSLVTMPAPVAFPLAGTLLRLGASLASVAAFITTLTMVGVVSAPLEIQHFGKRFTLVRQGLSFLLALTVGLLMGVVL
jgi:Predicted permeases